MALLALIIGSFLVSLGVAAVGVVVQDRAQKIASETRAGKWLGWLFLFPVLDQIDAFERRGRSSVQSLRLQCYWV